MGAPYKAESNDVPMGARAVMFKFKVRVGAQFSVVEKSVSVTYDRYRTNHDLFHNMPQMTQNAIHSVVAGGYDIIDFTTYIVP